MVQEEVTDTAVCRVMRGYSNRTQPYNKLHAQVMKFSTLPRDGFSIFIENFQRFRYILETLTTDRRSLCVRKNTAKPSLHSVITNSPVPTDWYSVKYSISSSKFNFLTTYLHATTPRLFPKLPFKTLNYTPKQFSIFNRAESRGYLLLRTFLPQSARI